MEGFQDGWLRAFKADEALAWQALSGLDGQFDEVPFLWDHLSGIAVVANCIEVILDWPCPFN